MNRFSSRRNPFVVFAALSLPFGYLFAPSSVTPLWFVVFILIFLRNLNGLFLGTLELLIYIVFPAYAVILALAFNSASSFPISHCFAILTPLVVYGVGKYLFSVGNYRLAVDMFAFAFWILALFVFFEFLVNGLGIASAVPQAVRASGFSDFATSERVSGFWIEPGHLGIAINFLFPFVILSKSLLPCDRLQSSSRKLVSKPFFFFSLFIVLFCSFATRSTVTILLTVLESLILFDPVMTLPLMFTFFRLSNLKSMVTFFLPRTRIWFPVVIVGFLLLLAYYALNDIKISSFVSYLYQLDIGESRDILSAGDRATRIQWVFDRIRALPFGHGLAPFYRSGAATGFDASSGLLSLASDAGYESSLSTPLDFSLWASPLWPILIVLFLYRRTRHSLKAIQYFRPLEDRSSCDSSAYSTVAVYCFAAMFAIVLAMFARFAFVANYYYPFLFLSLAFAAKTRDFLLFLYSFPPSLSIVGPVNLSSVLLPKSRTL